MKQRIHSDAPIEYDHLPEIESWVTEMIDSRVIADLLHGASTEVLKDADIEVTPPMLLNHMSSVFSFHMIMPALKMEKYDVVKHRHSASGVMRMLTDRLFAQVQDAYRYMVEEWGKAPVYYHDNRRDQDYLDGFVS